MRHSARVFLIAALAVAAGCAAQRGARDATSDLQRELAGLGRVSTDNVIVYHPAAMATQARQISDTIEAQFTFLRETTGFRTDAGVRVCLRRTGRLEWPYELVATGSNFMGLFLYAQDGRESTREIFFDNSTSMQILWHELVEGTLIGCFGGRTLTPTDWRARTLLGREKAVIHHTRWFREGFATYASVLAHRLMLSRFDIDCDELPRDGLQVFGTHGLFSLLDKVGGMLFSWDQFMQETSGGPKNPRETNVSVNDYYMASAALFFLIEERFGAESIRDILEAVNNGENLNGKALITVSNDVLGTDIEKMVEDFHFPRTGLYADNGRPLPEVASLLGLDGKGWLPVVGVENGGLAELAGIKKGDAILSIDGVPTLNLWSYETAILKRLDKESVTLHLWRHGVGEIDAELRLWD